MRALTIFVSGLLIVGAVAGYVFVSSHARPKIEFISLESQDPELIKAVAHQTAALMHVSYTIGERMIIPRSTYNAERKQCHAQKLITFIPASTKESDPHRVAIMDIDLGAPDTNFYFNYYDVINKRAVMSLARLRPEAYPGCAPNDELFLQRCVDEAAHNLAHTYGLEHCNNIGCIMGPSKTLGQIDDKRGYFCPTCKQKLEAGIQAQQNSDE